jgi:hypothetical protein
MRRILPFLAILAGCAPSAVPPEASADKELTAFAIASPSADGAVDGAARAVSVAVPAGTDLTALVAVYSATGVGVSVDGVEQESGVTANDFTEPVTYVVAAQDGSCAAYAVTVRAAESLSPDKELTGFSIREPPAAGEIDQETRAAAVRVPHGTDLTALVAVFSATGAAVTVDGEEQESGETVNDFTEPVTYVVRARDGSQAAYRVSVAAAPSTDKELTAFGILAPAATGLIDPASGIVRVRLEQGVPRSALTAVFQATGERVTVDGAPQESGTTVNDFTSPVRYVVEAEDGSTAPYEVRVTAGVALVINELDADQVGADAAEYVELYASADVDLAGLFLIQLNGGILPGAEYARVDLSPGGILPSGGYLVIAGPNVAVPAGAAKLTPPGWASSNRIQNGPNDALMVFDAIGGRVVDAVSYAGALHRAVLADRPGEWDAAEGAAGAPSDSNTAAGSVSRLPNGRDTGQNGADFAFTAALTPGTENR